MFLETLGHFWSFPFPEFSSTWALYYLTTWIWIFSCLKPKCHLMQIRKSQNWGWCPSDIFMDHEKCTNYSERLFKAETRKIIKWLEQIEDSLPWGSKWGKSVDFRYKIPLWVQKETISQWFHQIQYQLQRIEVYPVAVGYLIVPSPSGSHTGLFLDLTKFGLAIGIGCLDELKVIRIQNLAF